METVLITGASSGIGMEFAKRYAKDYGSEIQLVLVARRKEILDELGKELNKKYDTKCISIPVDLSKEYAADEVVSRLKELNILVDTLINNAGFATKGLLQESDFDRQHQEMNLNMLTLTELTYRLIGKMAENRHGTIINISSVSGFNPIPYNSVYAATKAFVLSFSQGIAYEYQDFGVKVIAVCPQAMDTHFFDDFNKMSDRMRSASDVVDTAIRGLKQGKAVISDGTFAKMQQFMHHVLSRKCRVKITGRVGKKTWGTK